MRTSCVLNHRERQLWFQMLSSAGWCVNERPVGSTQVEKQSVTICLATIRTPVTPSPVISPRSHTCVHQYLKPRFAHTHTDIYIFWAVPTQFLFKSLSAHYLFPFLVNEDRKTFLWTCLTGVYFYSGPAYCPS